MKYEIIVFGVIFFLAYIGHIISGNVISRHDGVRANCNCNVGLPKIPAFILFFSDRYTYNLWSFLAQCGSILFAITIMAIALFNQVWVISHYKSILFVFLGFLIVLELALFVDTMLYDRKHGTRY